MHDARECERRACNSRHAAKLVFSRNKENANAQRRSFHLAAALRSALAGAGLLAAAGLGIFQHASFAAEEAVVIPPPAVDERPAAGMETAVFAGGCFWGVQGVFQHVKGVSSAVSGYAGGEQSTAEYQAVGTGKTGHAESVEVTFDPAEISYGKLLQVFFSVAHNPTQLNCQGPDWGRNIAQQSFR